MENQEPESPLEEKLESSSETPEVLTSEPEYTEAASQVENEITSPEKESASENDASENDALENEDDSEDQIDTVVDNYREVTDVLLGKLFLVIATKNEVQPAFCYSFLKSRPVMWIGKKEDTCPAPAAIVNSKSIDDIHASIRWQKGQFFLQDEGGKSGTFFDDKKLTKNTLIQIPLSGNFRLGKVQFQYKIEGEDYQQSSSSMNQQGEPSFASFAAEEDSFDVVIAEFSILSLDAPYALPKHCEIMSKKARFVIGRALHCDYRVEFKEKYVADEQAVIIYSAQEEFFAIKSIMRENPIWVNNQKVKDAQQLKSGDVIRLGAASGAPRIRFALDGEEDPLQDTFYLSQLFPSLTRGQTLQVGNSEVCDLMVKDDNINGVVLEIKVPEKGEHLLVEKHVGVSAKVLLEEGEMHEKETRVWKQQQTLQVGNTWVLIHDLTNIVTPRPVEEHALSDFVPAPERETAYLIGHGEHCKIRVPDESLPEVIAELVVPAEGDYFYIRRQSESAKILIDNEPMPNGIYTEVTFGINQTLKIAEFFEVRNNLRSIPTPKSSGIWKKFLASAFLFILAAVVLIGGVVYGKQYWEKIIVRSSTQNLMQKYQQNVFYIMVFDKDGQQNYSGTGFLLTQKDAYENDIYYLITCKHVIQPWKFQEHQEKDGKLLGADGNPINENYFIAVWPFGTKALDVNSKSYQFEKSFTNHATSNKLGGVEIFRLGDDDYEEVAGGLRRHKKKTNSDLAILKLIPNLKEGDKWEYPYQKWELYTKKKIPVGEPAIALGYPLGGGRLLNKNGVVIPASCEGKLTSDCNAPDFLEIDVNQTQGASGGPIINQRSKIIGIVSFSDGEKKLVYGIHSAILKELMR